MAEGMAHVVSLGDGQSPGQQRWRMGLGPQKQLSHPLASGSLLVCGTSLQGSG